MMLSVLGARLKFNLTYRFKIKYRIFNKTENKLCTYFQAFSALHFQFLWNIIVFPVDAEKNMDKREELAKMLLDKESSM